MRTAELHTHDEWSLLDGCGSALDGAKRAAECGHAALAKTNHGVLSGTVHHVKACLEVGILPIVAVEAYYRPNRLVGAHYGKDSLEHTSDTWSAYHMVLLAKDLRGWRSLVRLTSEAYRSGFFRKPCIDDALLDLHHDGLIASTSCAGGYIPQAILRGDTQAVADHVAKLDRWFGDDWYWEIQPHDFDDQRVVNREIVTALAPATGKPVRAVKDAHFPSPAWHSTQKVSVLMRTKSTLEKSNERAQEDDDYYDLTAADTAYIGSADDTIELFQRYHPQLSLESVRSAVAATGDVVDQVTPFIFDSRPKLPRFRPDQTPDGDREQLEQIVADGLRKRGHGDDPAYVDQAAKEVQVFADRGVCSFFLITWDFVNWARDPTRPMPELPGGSTPENDHYYEMTAKGGCHRERESVGSRGSAGGSTVSYALEITQINPITYGLWFSRFLNEDRVGMPDIDLDLSKRGAKVVGEYVKRTYGENKVYDMIAHGTMTAKSVIQRVSRVYSIPHQEYQAVTKFIPDEDVKDNTPLAQLRELIPEIDRYAEAHPDLWTDAERLQGSVGSLSEHPAGKVISDVPLDNFMPVMRKAKDDDYMVTSFGEESSTEIVTKVFGLMKVDLLVINELAKLSYAEQLIKKIYDRDVQLDKLPPYEHPHDVEQKVMLPFQLGDTIGTFQYAGSASITSLTKRSHPETIDELTAINALHRTATMATGMHDEYVERRRDPERIEFWHPSVRDILSESLGLMIYQEQVMAVFVALGGFSDARADSVRRIMSKAYRIKGDAAAKMLAEHKDDFVGHASRITGAEMAEHIWTHIYGFCDYSFNKPHAGEYALKGYSGQWLKVHYPEVAYCAMLTFPPSKIKKPEERKPFFERVIRSARARGVEVLPPDVNDSDLNFTITGDGVRFGLQGVAGLGEKSVTDIIAGRPYDSLEALVEWTSRKGAKANAGARRALGGCGALDRWNVREHLTEDERLEEEERRLGIALSVPDRIGDLREPMQRIIHTSAEVDESADGMPVVVGGELIGGEERKTRKGPSLTITIAFGADEYRCSLAPWKYTDAVRALIDTDVALIVRGSRNVYYRRIEIDEIRPAREVVAELGMLPEQDVDRGRVNMVAFAA